MSGSGTRGPTGALDLSAESAAETGLIGATGPTGAPTGSAPAELNLTEQETPAPGPGPIVAELPYDPARDREIARRRLAFVLVGILGFTVFFSFITLWMVQFGLTDITVDNLVDVLNVLFAPLVALVGAATGFYYGAGDRDE